MRVRASPKLCLDERFELAHALLRRAPRRRHLVRVGRGGRHVGRRLLRRRLRPLHGHLPRGARLRCLALRRGAPRRVLLLLEQQGRHLRVRSPRALLRERRAAPRLRARLARARALGGALRRAPRRRALVLGKERPGLLETRLGEG